MNTGSVQVILKRGLRITWRVLWKRLHKGTIDHSPPCGQRTSWAFGHGVTHARVRFFVAKLNEQKMEAVYLDDSNRGDATAKED